MADGQVTIQVTNNAKEAARDFNALDKSLNKTEKGLKGVDKQADKTSDSFNGLRGAITAAVGVIAIRELAQFSKGLVDVASNAEETANKFNVVFSGVRGEAEATAQALAKGYGLASQEAQKLLSDTGDLLTGFGFSQQGALELSTQLNALAVDLASFTNIEGGSERAAAALTSALFGETEAAKSLGIVLTQDVVKAKVAALRASGELTTETDKEAKAIATLQLAYEQSKNAIGDFARSQDSYANQTRIANSITEDLSESIGSRLLPAATSGIELFNDLAGAIRDAFREADSSPLRTVAFELNEASLELKKLENGFNNSFLRKFDNTEFESTYAFKELTQRIKELKEEQNQLLEQQKAGSSGKGGKGGEDDPVVKQVNSLKLLQEQAAATKIELQNMFLAGNEDSKDFDSTKMQYEALTSRIQEVTDVTKDLKKQTQDTFDFAGAAADNFSRNAVESLVTPYEDGEKAADRFKQVALDTIKDVLVEFLAAELRKQAAALVTAIFTGGGSFFGGAASGAAGGAVSANATGGAFDGVKKYATGGIVGSGGGMVGSPTFFNAGGQLSVAGEAGAEAIMPAQRMSNGNMGVQVTQSPVVNNIYNNAPVQIQTVTRPNNQNDIIVTQVGNALTDSRTSQGLSEALSRNSQTGANAF